MDNYYHFTSYKNLESICRLGLIPKKGGRTRSIGDNRCGVFLSKGIQNAILMYSSILYHYNSHTGERGEKAIEYYTDRINQYNQNAKEIPLDEEDIAEMKAMNEAIEWIKQIMKYKDFFEYIDDGCYLTISRIDGITEIEPKDCYTNETISPEKIKVVTIKNKKTGKVIDSREKILAYFLSITPMESLIKSTPNVVTKKLITDLYDNKVKDISYYNSNNFEMEEISIKEFLLKKNNKEHDEER